MADENEEDLQLMVSDAGAAFRTEMAMTNFSMKYWRHILGVIGLGLVAVLVYGQYANMQQASQRRTTAEIRDALTELPYQLVTLSSRTDQFEEGDTDTIRSVAASLEQIGADAGGTSAAEAFVKAAELYRVLGERDAQRTALERAAGLTDGTLQFAVESGLANLDLESGNGDAAIQRLQALMDTNDGFLAQWAAQDLGLALEHLDRDGEARDVYTQYLTRWPEAANVEEIQGRQTALDGEG